MAYENLKSAIKQAVKQNDNQEITGTVLQNTLLSIVDNIPEIIQETGNAENKVMSQKATTTAIADETTRAKAAEEAIIFDVSVYNNGAVFESLQALLNSSNLNTLIPASARHGGISIRFIQGSEQSSDNKYVQYRLMSDTFNTTVTNWQGIDEEPTVGSANLVKSGGVYDRLNLLNHDVNGDYTKDLNWSSGYIDTDGVIQKSTKSCFSQPFILKAGNTISVGTNTNYITVIGRTNADSLSIGDTITPIIIEYDNNQFKTYTYTATEDIKLVICATKHNYNVLFHNNNCYNDVFNRIDEEPTVGSANLVKSGGIAKQFGCLYKAEVVGNNSSWTLYNNYNIIKAGESIKIAFTGPITFAGLDNTYTFLAVYWRAKNSEVPHYIFIKKGDVGKIDKLTVDFTATKDCYLCFEGRWHDTETLHILVCGGLIVQVNHNTIMQKNNAKVVDIDSIDFDNTNHKVVISEMILSNPITNNRLTVAASEIDYNFKASDTTSVWLTYSYASNNYRFIFAGACTTDDVVIACLDIRGYSTDTPNTSIVRKVHWCASTDWSLNGVSFSSRINKLESEVDNLENGIYENIIKRNIGKDAAVRATGNKAINSDILPLSFIHVSDIHTKGDNYKCFENACEFYEHYNNIKIMIVTGDIVWDTYHDPTTWYDEALTKTSKPVLNIIGNHDAGQYNSTYGLGSQSSDMECYNKFIAPYVNAGTLPNGVTVPGWGVVQPTNAATNGNSYYYKDFTDEKIRLIVLCEYETEYELNESDTALKYSREYRAMRQAQVTWFIDTLTNTPSDYGVIVAMHQIPDILGNEDNEFVSFDLVNNSIDCSVYSTDRAWLAKILNAFATKSSLTLTVTQTGAVVQNDATLNCNCDFTSVQSEFICVICGHTHKDYIGHLLNYPSVAVLCVGADNLHYTSTFQPRQEGTPSEDLFNVVNIDRNRKTIKIIRIGSDASVTGQVRDQMIMSYATT